jgi:hypothetical protein
MLKGDGFTFYDKSNMTGSTRGAGTAYPSGESEFISGF